MIRIIPIAITAALYGNYADAADCRPAFNGGTTYKAGDTVSATSTVETTASCTCTTSGCPTAAGQTSGCTSTTTTYETHNYSCVSGANSAFCSMNGFEPAGQYSSMAWTKDSATCSGTYTATNAPTPAVWQTDSGCPGAYVSGTDYDPEEKVSVAVAGTTYTGVYECVAAPNNLFCGKSGYEPGTGQYWENVWTLLGSCSGTISPTTSPAYSALTDAGGCPDAWEAGKYDEGDKVAKGGLVYQCNTFPYSGFCGQTGYEPNADDGTEFWKQAWTVVGYCSGTISPTTSPAFDPTNSVGGCPDEWVKGTAYEEGDLVAVTASTTPERKFAFKCKSWPFSGFCGQFGPTEFGGEQGWTKEGNCDGTISPTQAPAFSALTNAGGCPDKYSTSTTYEAGDQVAFEVATGTGTTEDIANGWRFVVYECKDFPNSLYCSQDAYKPGSDNQNMAWTVKGYCDGTMSPTQAPTAYDNTSGQTAPNTCEVEFNTTPSALTINKCYYEKDKTTTGVACTCSDSDCPNPNGLAGTSTACTKTTVETECPSVDVYSSSATYEAGDVVRIGNARFKCKAWPYYLWCSNSAYEPTTDPTDIWTDAWSTDGLCPS